MNKYEDNFKFTGLTDKIIGEAYKVHNKLGHGFLEKVYANALFKRLSDNGFKVEQQIPIDVRFEGIIIGEFFADLLVESKVIVELKAVENIIPAFEVQLVNY
ncbi:MAG: GxxExxY protein [Ignavibacteria bacterium]